MITSVVVYVVGEGKNRAVFMDAKDDTGDLHEAHLSTRNDRQRIVLRDDVMVEIRLVRKVRKANG